MTMQARITVLAFAQAREVFGWTERELKITSGTSLATILTELHPAWQEQLPTTRTAVNYDFVPLETILYGGETVALIPPVSGG